MTEIERLTAEIKRLKAEIELLRDEKNKRCEREAFPDAMLEKYPRLLKALGKKPVLLATREHYLQPAFAQKVASMIRETVFRDTGGSGENSKRASYVRILAMTDSQYELYLKTADAILAALEAGMTETGVGADEKV